MRSARRPTVQLLSNSCSRLSPSAGRPRRIRKLAAPSSTTSAAGIRPVSAIPAAVASVKLKLVALLRAPCPGKAAEARRQVGGRTNPAVHPLRIRRQPRCRTGHPFPQHRQRARHRPRRGLSRVLDPRRRSAWPAMRPGNRERTRLLKASVGPSSVASSAARPKHYRPGDWPAPATADRPHRLPAHRGGADLSAVATESSSAGPVSER